MRGASLYRNGADAVIQTALWLIAAAIEHALVLSLALCVILVGTHATLLGGRDGDGAIRAGPQEHAVGGPQCVGLHSARSGIPTFETPPAYPRLFDSPVGAGALVTLAYTSSSDLAAFACAGTAVARVQTHCEGRAAVFALGRLLVHWTVELAIIFSAIGSLEPEVQLTTRTVTASLSAARPCATRSIR